MRLLDYIEKLIEIPRIILAFLLTCIAYLIFPVDNYQTAITVVLISIVLDIITKQYSIIKQAGGYRNAVCTGKLLSGRVWHGTVYKLYSYFIVAILNGLAYRIVPYNAVLNAGVFIYFIMFLREAESIIENLIDSGADLYWLLDLLKFNIKKLIDKSKEDKK